MKRCYVCEATKPLIEFYKNVSTKDGLQSMCKICTKRTQRATHILDPSRRSEGNKKRYYKNHELSKQRARKKHAKFRSDKPNEFATYQAKQKLAGYGLSLEEYDKMLLDQGHKCKLCPIMHIKSKSLCVDHNHATGLVRGLLCRSCNSMLGLAKDSPITLANGIAYLENDSLKNTFVKKQF